MTHEIPESFDPQHPQGELQAAAADTKVDLLEFMALRSQTARSRAAERNGQGIEGYDSVSPDDIDDEH